MRPTSSACLAGCLAVSLGLAACRGDNNNGEPPAVDTTAPETTISAAPAAATRANSATFAFSASETGASFEVSVDGAAYMAATSPVSFTSLSAGTHMFSVRARDGAGNVDSTPATFTWAVDLIPPSARIVFPTPISYTDASKLTVRGNANDAYGVSAVSVNGVSATSTDGYQTWEAVVPIALGQNSLAVNVTDVAGNVATSATTASVINRGPPNYRTAGVDYDPVSGRIIAADSALNAILAYRMTDRIARVLSPTPGSPNGRYGITDLTIDAPRNRAILVEYTLDALIAVDLDSGERSVIAPTAGGPPTTKFPYRSIIALDAASNRAFVSNPNYGTIIRVDLTTGVRSIVSGDGVGAGSALVRPAGLVYDDATTPGTPRLLVSQGGVSQGLGAGNIVAVDLATGDRTSAFPPAAGGQVLDSPAELRLDPANQRLIVMDTGWGAVFGIDFATGDRTVLTGSGVGAGPDLVYTRGLAFDPASNRAYTGTSAGDILAVDLASKQRSAFAHSRVGDGLTLNYPEGLVIEQASGTAASLLLTDRGVSPLMRVNLATGMRTAVSDARAGIGSGPPLAAAVDVVLDTRPSASGHSALVMLDIPAYQLLSVDLNSGDRTQLADLSSSGVALGRVGGFRLDAGGNRVLLTSTDAVWNNAVYAVDLATGALTTIMDADHGTGPAFTQAANITLDPVGSPARALVSDLGLGGIFTVDLASGNRTLLVERFPDVGYPGDNVPSGTFLDTRNSRLLSIRVGAVNNLFAVALSGGSQQILSGEDPNAAGLRGTGPLPYGCVALDASSTDDIAFAACPWIGAVMLIDLHSGDRVLVAR